MKEDYDWVVKVITSCEREEHLDYIPGIIKLFGQKHHDSSAVNDLRAMLILRTSYIEGKANPDNY
jgi:hypothetical protein